MNEPLLERISQLERSVKRWRLCSFCLFLLLILVLAVGGIFTAIPATEPGDFWHFLPWVRARHQEEMARREALQALREAEAVRQQMEAKRLEKQAAPAGEVVNK